MTEGDVRAKFSKGLKEDPALGEVVGLERIQFGELVVTVEDLAGLLQTLPAPATNAQLAAHPKMAGIVARAVARGLL